MPVDYSKWDALELSDDSDIEVHPNVDKRSFIRAKQNQIHQQRVDRKHRITTLKYERVVNDGLLVRIDALLKSLESHKRDVESKKQADEVDEVVFDALMEVGSDPSLGDDYPPKPPEGVHSQEAELSYSKMMVALLDQVKAEINTSTASGPARYQSYITEVGGHKQKVTDLQKNLNIELTKLEKEEGSKITSESIHTGFSSSHVSKAQPIPSSTTTPKTTEPELLNPGTASASSPFPAAQPGADPDSDSDETEASPTAKQFARLKPGDYTASLQFISAHPEILSERETDGLLVEAFNAQMDATSQAQQDYARQCVHQALLLQYCRQLGKDGVGLFFRRVQTPGHQAQKLFVDDVNSTYARIRTRTAELAKERAEEGSGDREQIQLHAVDPGTSIHIVTPPVKEECRTEDERVAREIFDTFSPGLQRALEAGSLDKVNEVLGKMSVEDAERVVEQLGSAGMLSLEEGVIDATTDEGKKQVEEIERTRQLPGDQTGVGVEDMD